MVVVMVVDISNVNRKKNTKEKETKEKTGKE
jgi:hypothetical protein